LVPIVGIKREDLAVAEQAYCVKCKAKTDVKNPEKVTMKNGREALKGICEKCGTGVYKILGKAK
jgi:hypothetical protein